MEVVCSQLRWARSHVGLGKRSKRSAIQGGACAVSPTVRERQARCQGAAQGGCSRNGSSAQEHTSIRSLSALPGRCRVQVQTKRSRSSLRAPLRKARLYRTDLQARRSFLRPLHAPAATPKRPSPGNFSAGRRMSTPRTAPKKLSSKPSTQPTVKPRYPAMETNTPVPDGETPNQRPSYGKSFAAQRKARARHPKRPARKCSSWDPAKHYSRRRL